MTPRTIPRLVTAVAPTRIDLAGGTLDLWPIHHLLDVKATVNVGVTLDARTEVRPSTDGAFHFESQDQGARIRGDFATVARSNELPLLGLLLGAIWSPQFPAIELKTAAKSPAGAGLGGSSCLGITVAAALGKARATLTGENGGAIPGDEDLIRIVQDVEARLIRAPTGVQDYWGGVRGRVNVLRFPFGGTVCETIDPARLSGLADELICCYSGKSRQSAINNWEIFKRLFDGDQALLAVFNEIGAAAGACAAAVEAGDLPRALAFSEKEWALRTRLWPKIETDETKRLDAAAKAAGARFSRVCGAGGGGVMGVFAPKAARAQVCAALQAAGGTVLDAGVADYGLVVRAG
jgi:D-glycero-alpha-D-manno-heptose-7-phosphate kinase